MSTGKGKDFASAPQVPPPLPPPPQPPTTASLPRTTSIRTGEADIDKPRGLTTFATTSGAHAARCWPLSSTGRGLRGTGIGVDAARSDTVMGA
jgi:hypothetical protein